MSFYFILFEIKTIYSNYDMEYFQAKKITFKFVNVFIFLKKIQEKTIKCLPENYRFKYF